MSPLIKLKSSPKQYTLDQDKARDPQATVKYAQEHLRSRYDLSNFKIEEPVSVISSSCQCSVTSGGYWGTRVNRAMYCSSVSLM